MRGRTGLQARDEVPGPGRRPPPCLPGFEGVRRYWDPVHRRFVAKILPGEFYVTDDGEELLATVLGSCVAACVRDPVAGVGGMNHFMLPVAGEAEPRPEAPSAAARYGAYAMEALINEVLKHGGRRERLEVKVAGGGELVSARIGRANAEFVRRYLEHEGLEVAAADLGGPWPRKVLYLPATGKMRVRKLRRLHNTTIAEREQDYLHTLEAVAPRGSVELWD